jgi:hypothetical protein
MRFVFLIGLGVLLGACTPRLTANVEHFSDGFTASPSNVYFVRPIPSAGDEPTIEERSYAAMLADQLSKAGHTVTQNLSEASHVILFGLQIGAPNTRTSVGATPVYGMVPSGTSVTTGYNTGGFYSARTTQMQTFGVTGYMPTSVTTTTFTRVGSAVIFPAPRSGTPRPVSQIRVRSEGSCGMLSSVAPTLARAVVERLGKPGAETIDLPFEGRC